MTATSTPIVARLDGSASFDGPLAGVRTTVKELIAVDGVVLSANTSVVLPTAVTDVAVEAPIVSLLRSAGSQIVSISTTHELAWGITTWTDGRRVENPVVDGRVAGGSSGGAAALVALGDADLGVGTDTAGSIRIPAAWCGVVGWKPTFDLASTEHVLPLAPGFDTVGFLAREVELLERVADVLDVSEEERGPLRIAELRVDGAIRDAGLRSILDGALSALHASGHEITDPVRGPSGSATVSAYATLQLDASLRAHRDELGTWPAQAERYGSAIRRRLNAAEELDDDTLAAAHDARTDLRRAADGWFRSVDALILPATGCGPPAQGRPDEVEIDGIRHDLRSVVLPHTTIANLIGAPAVSVPAKVGGEPTGLQILTPPGTDRRALRLAAALMA